MPTLVELATQIVTAQTTSSSMSTDDIVLSLTKIHSTLGQLEGTLTQQDVRPHMQERPQMKERALTVKTAFKKNEIICMVCGKSFQMLGQHLSAKHGLSPRDYRKRFNLPADQPLTSKMLLEKHRANVESLGKARKAEKTAEVKTTEVIDAPKKRRGRKPGSMARKAEIPAG